MSTFLQSYSAGYACLAAWSDLIDSINVFPVADGDTGTNLRISLAPLRDHGIDVNTTRKLLACCATGNSGNIAAAFFREFCTAQCFSELAARTTLGRDKAWQAIAAPCPGTMLDVFDSLAEVLISRPDQNTLYPLLTNQLQQAVHTTSHTLPSCEEAGVVDSGALAMYIFFDGFFSHLTRQDSPPAPLVELFAGNLAINSSFLPETSHSHCVDIVLQPHTKQSGGQNRDDIAQLGESVVVVEDANTLKVHIHTPDPRQLRTRLEQMGEVLQWSDEAITQSLAAQQPDLKRKTSLHIMTDAAGSMPRDLARRHGITLLDSYIITEGRARPESLYCPDQLYPLMREGKKITTAQAGTFERHQQYTSVCQQFAGTLYLCVGSAFTGNCSTAMAWKKEYDTDNLLTIIDTGAASGRLALIALLTARWANSAAHTPDAVIAYARQLIASCAEFVFIDELKYLVAGGRISRVGGFFGDLLHMKPVISPTHSGVQKVGMVRSREEQLEFALNKLTQYLEKEITPVIMLNYTDNKEWITETVQPQMQKLNPEAEILILPLSLTSAVHMGPGTWSVSMAPVTP